MMSGNVSVSLVRRATGSFGLSCGLAFGLGLLGLGGCAQTGSRLKVEVPPEQQDASVMIDGQYVGVLSELNSEQAGLVRLAPGQHRLELQKPGYFPYQRAVTVPRRKAPPQIEIQAQLYERPDG